jgi:preprotein translocase subunit SecB
MSEQDDQQQLPMFGIEKIYLKDMSLEVPNAPAVFFEAATPQIQVNVHNQATALPQEALFEVVLTVTVTAKVDEKTVFLVEAAQAGIFQIRNVPQPELDAVLGTLCPNTLQPYAREAVSSLVQRAGFMPVQLQHMNFDAIYQQRLQELQQQQQQAQAAPQQKH